MSAIANFSCSYSLRFMNLNSLCRKVDLCFPFATGLLGDPLPFPIRAVESEQQCEEIFSLEMIR